MTTMTTGNSKEHIVSNWKSQFPIFRHNPELIYLDSAASSQKPQIVIDRITDFYAKENANVHRGIYQLSENATESYESARAAVAKHINANTNEIIFTSGSTASSNLLAMGHLQNILSEGDIVISSVAEHHSNFLPLQQVALRKGAQLKLVGLDDDFGFNYADFEQLLKLNGNKVKVVALSAVTNVTGSITDMTRIRGLLDVYAKAAVLIVDAAQLVGHDRVHVQEMDCDYLFFSAHKLMAETGLGVLYVAERNHSLLSPVSLGGGMVELVEETGIELKAAPQRYEAGTPHISGVLSLAAAIAYLEGIGLEAIATHEKKLTEQLISELLQIPEIHIIGPTKSLKNRAGVVAFEVTGIHAHDVAEFLASRHVAVRAGHHCAQLLHRQSLDISSSVRASLHLYNESTDITALVTALKECLAFFAKSANPSKP